MKYKDNLNKGQYYFSKKSKLFESSFNDQQYLKTPTSTQKNDFFPNKFLKKLSVKK